MRHVGDGLLTLSYHVGAPGGIARQSPLGIESHGAMQEDHVPHSDGVTVRSIHWIELIRRDDLLGHGRLPPAPESGTTRQLLYRALARLDGQHVMRWP